MKIEKNGYGFYTIDSGFFRLDGGAMFGLVPKVLWEKRIEADSENCIPLGLRCVLFRDGKNNILFDSGMGNTWDESSQKAFGLKNQSWTSLLKPYALTPEEITHVVITHLHFDHVGGLIESGDDGSSKVTFANAEHIFSRQNFEYAQSPSLRERGSYNKRYWEPLEKKGQIRLVDLTKEKTEILPRVWAEKSDGHTQGQLIPYFDFEGHRLAYAGDLLPTQHHAAPAWGMGYDAQPNVLIEEKLSFLERAAVDKVSTVLEHDAVTDCVEVQREKSSSGREKLTLRPQSFE